SVCGRKPTEGGVMRLGGFSCATVPSRRTDTSPSYRTHHACRQLVVTTARLCSIHDRSFDYEPRAVANMSILVPDTKIRAPTYEPVERLRRSAAQACEEGRLRSRCSQWLAVQSPWFTRLHALDPSRRMDWTCAATGAMDVVVERCVTSTSRTSEGR